MAKHDMTVLARVSRSRAWRENVEAYQLQALKADTTGFMMAVDWGACRMVSVSEVRERVEGFPAADLAKVSKEQMLFVSVKLNDGCDFVVAGCASIGSFKWTPGLGGPRLLPISRLSYLASRRTASPTACTDPIIKSEAHLVLARLLHPVLS
jgi:hypothetical protein